MSNPEGAALAATETALKWVDVDLDKANTFIALANAYALLDIARALRSFE